MRPCDTCSAAFEGKCLAALSDQPTVVEYEADGVFVAQILIEKVGTFSPQHSHAYPHLTHLPQGSVRVHADGVAPKVLVAPTAHMIPANTMHLFETLTDNVLLLCIHNVSRTGAVEIKQEHQIVEPTSCL